MTVQELRTAYPDNLVIMSDSERPVEYLDMVGVGKWFGVPGTTVAQWRHRYADSHPIPVPDVVVGRTAGWAPAREAEWRAWHSSRPGQGAGGGRRPRGSSAPRS